MANSIWQPNGDPLVNIRLVDNGDGTYSLATSTLSGGGAATVADGANIVEGSTTDAAATAGGTGTFSAKLRVLTGSIGAIADAAWVSGSGSVIALLKAVRGALPAALGQGTMAQSLPVVQASDSGSPVLVTATIADATSLSPGVDLGGRALVGIVTPSGWTTAVLTFQVSPDNVTWFEYEDVNGTTIQIPSTAASKYRALDAADFIGVRYLKVRSGTSAAAVNQAGGDIVTLVTRSVS